MEACSNMVQFYKMSPKPNLGDAAGQGLLQGATQSMQQQFQRGQLQRALGQLENLPPDASQIDLAKALLYSTAGLPDQGRVVSALFPLLAKNQEARASQRIRVAGEEAGLPPIPQGQPLPQFGQINQPGQPQQVPQPNKFFPNNIGPQEAPGNLPQPATEGLVRPILTTAQMIAEAKRVSKEKTDAGIPTTVAQAMDEVKIVNEENKAYNAEVEKERQQRVASQRTYGELSSQLLKKVFPEATDEQSAVFKKIGEDAAAQGKSEGEIERKLAREATKFKNTITNIKNDLSASRSYKTLHRKFLGTEKDFQSASNDLRVKLKPLLDLGLYDTSRNLLNDLGYYPEERESVINPLSDRAKSVTNLMPQAKKTQTRKKQAGIGVAIPSAESITETYAPGQKEIVQQQIKDIFDKDPKTSIVLMRKAFEDKGYDWRIFKDALNALTEIPPEQGGIKLDDDQFNQLEYLDSPPLNLLEKMLHSVNIIGR